VSAYSYEYANILQEVNNESLRLIGPDCKELS
jgi:hypothetical protein